MKQWFVESGRNAVVVAKIVLLLSVPTALLVMHVWNQYRLSKLGYEIAEATEQHQNLLEENKKLTVEARLQGRSDRVAEVARQVYGLQEPRPGQFVSIDGDDGAEPREHARLEESDEDPSRSVVQ